MTNEPKPKCDELGHSWEDVYLMVDTRRILGVEPEGRECLNCGKYQIMTDKPKYKDVIKVIDGTNVNWEDVKS